MQIRPTQLTLRLPPFGCSPSSRRRIKKRERAAHLPTSRTSLARLELIRFRLDCVPSDSDRLAARRPRRQLDGGRRVSRSYKSSSSAPRPASSARCPLRSLHAARCVCQKASILAGDLNWPTEAAAAQTESRQQAESCRQSEIHCLSSLVARPELKSLVGRRT